MSANTYTYDLTGEMHSIKTAEFTGSGVLLSPFFIGPANYAVQTNETQDTIGQKYIAQFQSDLQARLNEQFSKQGYNVLGVTIVEVSYKWTVLSTGTWWSAPFVPYPLNECSLSIKWTARVTLDKSLSASPFPTWAFEIIKWVGTAILAALILYWTIQAVKDVWISMTTDKTTITEYNPDGSIKKTETMSPNPLGITSVAVGIGIVVAVSVGAYLLLKGSQQRKRR